MACVRCRSIAELVSRLGHLSHVPPDEFRRITYFALGVAPRSVAARHYANVVVLEDPDILSERDFPERYQVGDLIVFPFDRSGVNQPEEFAIG